MPRKRHRLAQRRKAVGLSQERLAEVIGVDRVTVGRWERAESEPQPWHRPRLARALKVSVEELAALLVDVGDMRSAGPVSDALTDANKNIESSPATKSVNDELRQLLHGFVTQPGQRLSSNLMANIDHVRRSIDRTLATAGSVSLSQVDAMEARLLSNAHQCLSEPPVEMLCRLTLDVAEVQDLVIASQPPPVQQGLYRIAALLSTLIADELMVLGDVRQSQAWHATAGFAADQTNDTVLRADVRTFAALLPLYYGDANQAVRLARQAQSIGAEKTCLTRAIAPAYEAVGLAQLGAFDASRAALSVARQQVEELDAAYQIESIFGFAERRWRFHEGKVLSYLGQSDAAWAVHDEALALYPEDVPGDPALIRFDRAISLIRDKQVAYGCQLAEQTLTDLPDEHRTDIFLRAARGVLGAVPSGQRTQSAVRQYRQTLRGCAVVLRQDS